MTDVGGGRRLLRRGPARVLRELRCESCRGVNQLVFCVVEKLDGTKLTQLPPPRDVKIVRVSVVSVILTAGIEQRLR